MMLRNATRKEQGMNDLVASENDLLPINYEGEQPTVSGRALHKALEVETPYRKWFPRMCE